MTTHFFQQGTMIRPSSHNIVHDDLPVGVYKIELDDAGFYLEQVPELGVTGRLYGDVEARAKRIINTYHERPNNTGVLLSGTKGSGKTMLARLLSEKLTAKGISTIIVARPYDGDSLGNFLKQFTQPMMILFDEFEKVYHEKPKQETLLTVFDGLYNSKRLHVVTVNDAWNLTTYMKNRPGRFFYHYLYEGLDEEFIKEYCDDNLKDITHLPDIVSSSKTITDFNFDVLKAIVEEINRYGEPMREIAKHLNISPATRGLTFVVTNLEVKNPALGRLVGHPEYRNEGHPLESSGTLNGEFTGSKKGARTKPQRASLNFTLAGSTIYDEEAGEREPSFTKVFTLRPQDVKSFRDGLLVYDLPDFTLTLVQQFERRVHYSSLL